MNFSTLISELLIILFGYFLGSIPSGYLAGKWIKGIDLRAIGSGSTGATNVLREVGKKPALIVFLIDVLKGTTAVFIAKEILLMPDIWQVIAGISALIGHIWPIWLKGKGGKAVATGLGMLLGLSWQVGLACLGVFLIVLITSKIVSLSSIVAVSSLPLLMILNFKDNFSIPYFSSTLIAMIFIFWRHRTNIKRLIAGTEPKLGEQL